MTAHSLPFPARRWLGRAAIGAALLALVAALWLTVRWYLGSPASYWITTLACAAYLTAYFGIARWAIDKHSAGDDLPPCLALVGTMPHLRRTTADGRLVNVASMCGDCQVKMGATSPLRACPLIEARRTAGARS